MELITIDFWNTLFNGASGDIRNHSRNKVLLNTLNDLGISIDKDKFDIILKKSWEYYNHCWINECRTPNATEILNFIWQEMKFAEGINKANNDRAFKYIVDFFENTILIFPPDLEPGAKEAITELSAKYKLAIVSDTGFSPGEIVDQLLIKLDIRKYFSAFSYSDQTGVAKPHPKAFLTILEKLNVKPENAIHIGDIDRTDIDGAKAIGMKAIRYDGNIDKNLIDLRYNKSNADFITSSWNEIVEYIEKQCC
ncbi:MAG: HAD family hydrolase [Bacteroidetes bacterium]|nr:HAD family hydrolase [Bacteroidota bacterium]